MDDEKKLILWAVNNDSAKITNFSWPNKFNLDYSDYLFHFSLGARKFEGRGVGPTSEISLVKAVAEAIERTSLYENNIETSNGVAAHFSFIQAKENAISELIERDVFLCTFLCPEAGVKRIRNDALNLDLKKIINVLLKNKVEVKVYELGNVLDRSVILVIANGFSVKKPFGCIVGLGANRSRITAIESALIEMCRNVVTYIENENCYEWLMSESDFFQARPNEFSIIEHAKIALCKSYSEWLWGYFSSKEQYNIGFNNIRESEIKVKELAINQTFSNLGIVVVQASSSLLQNLFFQKTSIDKVNLNRLEVFAGKPISFENLNLRTHPIA